MAYAARTNRVDPTRVYLIGFSAGSFITWEYALRHPTELAAMAHISGGDSGIAGCRPKDTPVWAFHARDDQTVLLDEDLRTLAAINACPPGERDKLTVFPRGGHGIDEGVLTGALMGQGEPGFDPYDVTVFSWLLQHTR